MTLDKIGAETKLEVPARMAKNTVDRPSHLTTADGEGEAAKEDIAEITLVIKKRADPVRTNEAIDLGIQKFRIGSPIGSDVSIAVSAGSGSLSVRARSHDDAPKLEQAHL